MMDLSVLNSVQRQAAEHLEGPLLILAGAGSGKTQTLTYRMANLVEHGVHPYHILALTFTNKAAKEMRERVELLIGNAAEDMWVSTFHSCCARILRMDIDKLGRERNFVIYDDSDQMNLIGDIIKQLGIADKDLPKREIKERISDAKNKSEDPEQYLKEAQFLDQAVLRVFRRYQAALQEANALDFDDLLLFVLRLFRERPDMLEKYRKRFSYVFVDEYQDTNHPQYRFIELLCREHGNICVVGDDDQSIYGWRGADIRNILEFERDFPGAEVIRLEQNYRSTANILDAANGVISRNLGRKAKRLWTQSPAGDKIQLYTGRNERDEGDFICRMILEEQQQGRKAGDFAVLYRMNAQSRVIENTLVSYGIAYRIYGGVRFYDRKEIRDIMAYLRLIYNPNDNMAFLRIINVPRRAIGAASIAALAETAQGGGKSMLLCAMSDEGLDAKLKKKLLPFIELITECIALCAVMPLSEFMGKLIEMLAYEDYLRAEDKKNETEARMENLYELIGNIKEIERDIPEGESALQAFLENVALISDADSGQGGEEAQSVSLMTLHSAKGLEFPVVFLAGMEENIFPTARARNDLQQSAIEEERRLAYVGITRACEKLYLVNARERMLFGSYSINKPSRFIEEIPEELIENRTPVFHPMAAATRSPQTRAATPAYITHGGFGVKANRVPPALPYAEKSSDKTFSPYQRVTHAKFGEGTVLEVSGSGSAMMVQIDFGIAGVKRFAAAYAPIKPLEE